MHKERILFIDLGSDYGGVETYLKGLGGILSPYADGYALLSLPKLAAQMRAQGTEMISPHRSNKKRKTQDGRRLRRYERRWIVERFFAWIQWQRRLLVRWEYYPTNFLGFVQLAALCILLKQF